MRRGAGGPKGGGRIFLALAVEGPWGGGFSDLIVCDAPRAGATYMSKGPGTKETADTIPPGRPLVQRSC